MPPVARRGNFSNPMYDEFHKKVDDALKASARKSEAENEEQTSSPVAASSVVSADVNSPSPVVKKKGLLAKFMNASPLTRRRAQSKENGIEVEVEDGDKNGEPHKQFSPTHVDTGKDTQALVEED